MKHIHITLAALLALTTQINAQGPGGPGEQVAAEDPIARLMVLDKNKDGKLTEDEYTDSRLKPLLERADADKNKVITREELTTLMQRQVPGGAQGPGGPGRGGEGGRGGREGEFGGRGGREGGMRGPMMRPGTILPDFLVQELQLSEEQRTQLAKLQASVDAELAKILTQDQQFRLKQFGERRPEGGRGGFEAGPGGPGGRPGPGGPGGDFRPGEGRPNGPEQSERPKG